MTICLTAMLVNILTKIDRLGGWLIDGIDGLIDEMDGLIRTQLSLTSSIICTAYHDR